VAFHINLFVADVLCRACRGTQTVVGKTATATLWDFAETGIKYHPHFPQVGLFRDNPKALNFIHYMTIVNGKIHFDVIYTSYSPKDLWCSGVDQLMGLVLKAIGHTEIYNPYTSSGYWEVIPPGIGWDMPLFSWKLIKHDKIDITFWYPM
jgi:hypothetical protein